MRFIPAEPDIATVFNRIVDKDIDLQPDFQRGEVWSVAKQQRLIDSILRGWIVPPILLVSPLKGSVQQVLDGQQRLASIRDFKLNKFSVDGRIDPRDSKITQLHGKKYSELPTEIVKAFDRTTLRIYEITDYSAEEPAEIFFRLNQPTALTAAEKRNAFFGPVRDQIRQMVGEFELNEDAQKLLGFSNTRMAYDDVMARFACSLEFNTLRKKITASAVNEMYRRASPLSEDIYSRMTRALYIMKQVLEECGSKEDIQKIAVKLNKATFYSWLMFFVRIRADIDIGIAVYFFSLFETIRLKYANLSSQESVNDPLMSGLLDVYADRSTARVADASSVLLRDFSLWQYCFASMSERIDESIDPAHITINAFRSYVNKKIYQSASIESIALSYIDHIQWGAEIQHEKG